MGRTPEGRAYIGDANGFVPLSAAVPEAETVNDVLPRAAAGDLPAVDTATAIRRAPDALTFATPLERFGKLWGIGLNYRDHADDLEESWPDDPASFMKPHTTVTGPGGPIRLPPEGTTGRVTAEAELGVVIGRTAADCSPERAEDVIAGYVPVLDMTAEDVLQQNPRYLTRAKSFDTFLVVGPWIATPDEVAPLTDVSVRTVINGETRAENAVRNMRTGPRELVAFHSEVMTLRPGDLIFTGTPGAAPIHPGDTAEAVIDGLGSVAASVVR